MGTTGPALGAGWEELGEEAVGAVVSEGKHSRGWFGRRQRNWIRALSLGPCPRPGWRLGCWIKWHRLDPQGPRGLAELGDALQALRLGEEAGHILRAGRAFCQAHPQVQPRWAMFSCCPECPPPPLCLDKAPPPQCRPYLPDHPDNFTYIDS